ncbi:MAG: hypothetical protein M0026_14150 [Nocardiopsaceae bacterium]|nr:hypothetical protein [Nocardiopsaceae bacterium]
MLALGLKPDYIAIGRDHTTQASGGVSFQMAGADAQHVAVIVKLGVAAEERYYSELGYTEQSHPEFVRDMRARSGAGDEIFLSSLQENNPRLVINQEQAWADARRMVANPAFWELTKALGREAGQRLYMETDAIMEAAAPFEPATLLEREGIRAWVPGAEQVRKAWEAAQFSLKDLLSEETQRNPRVSQLAEEVRRQAAAAAQERVADTAPERNVSQETSADPKPQAGTGPARMSPATIRSALRAGQSRGSGQRRGGHLKTLFSRGFGNRKSNRRAT